MKHAVVIVMSLLACGATVAAESTDAVTPPKQPVVLLHGLARTSSSMNRMARELERAGFAVCNVSYPSRKHDIETLTAQFVLPAIDKCFPARREPVHFVTHSLGGIIVRQVAAAHPDIAINRVVMLSPPNGGSEVVDKLGSLGLFAAVNGPAGRQLGTDTQSMPRKLGAATFELGIITGTRSVNPILSRLIPGTDDGKVSILSAQLDGMKAFMTVRATHPFIMRKRSVLAETVHFLAHGEFTRDERLPSPTRDTDSG